MSRFREGTTEPRLRVRLPGQDRIETRQRDFFYLALLAAAEDTPIPEMYEIFGSHAVQKFLMVFSGLTIEVPGTDLLKDCVRDAIIYERTRELGGKRRRERILSELQSEYGLDRDRLLLVRRRMHRLAVNAGVVNAKKREKKSKKAEDAPSGT